MTAESNSAALLVRLLDARRPQLHPRDVLGMLSLLLGDRAQVGDASRYLFEYGRRTGYDLPAYPLDGSGEIREFFADEGVRNVPEWYERKLGVPPQLYARLHARTMVVVRDAESRRRAFVLDAVRHRHDVGFAKLAESGLDRALAPAELDELLARLLVFLLGEGSQGEGAFHGVVSFESRVF